MAVLTNSVSGMQKRNNTASGLAGWFRKGAQLWRPFCVWVGALAAFAVWSGAVAAASPCAPDRVDERATVRKVFDGDTVELTDGRHVRFIGINAPEVGRDGKPSEPFAAKARTALESALKKDPTVLLRYDAERFDAHQRTLAHLYLSDRRSIEAMLLEQGLAFWIAIPPGLHDAECYRGREQHARSAKRGIWSNSYYAPLDAQQVGPGAEGFHVVKGRVERIGKSKNTIWLNLAPHMALRIAREDLQYFTRYKPESLRGREVVARGWITPFKNGDYVMRVRHPAALEVQ